MSDTQYFEFLAKFGGTQLPAVTVLSFADAVRMEAESIRAAAARPYQLFGQER